MAPETEKEKFFRRLAEKRAEGLIHFHVSVKPPDSVKTGDLPYDEEEIYAELNRMEDAPTVPMRDGLF